MIKFVSGLIKRIEKTRFISTLTFTQYDTIYLQIYQISFQKLVNKIETNFKSDLKFFSSEKSEEGGSLVNVITFFLNS